MTPCMICTRPTTAARAMVLDGAYYPAVCDNCASGASRNPDSSAAEFHRQRQREDHAGDIVQPRMGGKPDLEFARLYPDQWENHYTEEEINQIRREL